MFKPPSLNIPKYDLRKSIPAPDISWDDFTPIKESPILFSPLSPLRLPFQEKFHQAAPSSKPKLVISPEKSFEIKAEQEQKPIIENNENQNLNSTEQVKSFDSVLNSDITQAPKINRLFLPESFEEVSLKYRPFGSFGAATRRLTAAKKRELREQGQQN